MLNFNSMSPVRYAAANLGVGGVACYLFYRLCLTCIQMPFSGDTLNWEQSVFFFVYSCAALMFMGIVNTISEYRNFENVCYNVFISLGLTVAVLVYRFRPFITAAILILWVGCVVFYSVRVFGRRLPRGRDGVFVVMKRARDVFHMSRALLAAALLCCTLLFFFTAIFGTGMSKVARVRPDSFVVPTDNSLIKTNYEVLKKIDEPYWSGLCHDEKLDVLQCVVNTEATFLGFPRAPVLMADVLPPGMSGFYVHVSKTITISRGLLDMGAVECLLTVLHECFHCYQHFLCEAYMEMDDGFKSLRMFDQIAGCVRDFSSYQPNGAAYFSQSIEVAAEVYAYGSVDEYFEVVARLRGELDDVLFL